MTKDEQDQIGALLKSFWPRAFNDANMDFYARSLAHLPFADVENAICTHQANSKFRPMLNGLLIAVQGAPTGENTAPSRGSTGHAYADALRASMTPKQRSDTKDFNAKQVLIYVLRGWYSGRVLRHHRAVDRSRSASDLPAAGIVESNAVLLRETQTLMRDGTRMFMAELGMSEANAQQLAAAVLSERSDYDFVLDHARFDGNGAAQSEPGDGELPM